MATVLEDIRLNCPQIWRSPKCLKMARLSQIETNGQAELLVLWGLPLAHREVAKAIVAIWNQDRWLGESQIEFASL